MSETQLERSVLEAKEREELFAIADALGAKPAARAKKADLVTQILRATGIEDAGGDAGADGGDKPKRTRARKATAAPARVTAAAPGAEAPDSADGVRVSASTSATSSADTD